jgi:hypothetical protein
MHLAQDDEREEADLSEYVQFAGAMVLFIGILLGSYWFVLYSPESTARREERRRDERERESE